MGALRARPALRAFASGLVEAAQAPLRQPAFTLIVGVMLAAAVGPATAVFNVER